MDGHQEVFDADDRFGRAADDAGKEYGKNRVAGLKCSAMQRFPEILSALAPEPGKHADRECSPAALDHRPAERDGEGGDYQADQCRELEQRPASDPRTGGFPAFNPSLPNY